jgi:ribonuclease Z
VYSHIVKLYGRTEDEIMNRTKADYSGPLIMGEDLMSFSIRDTIIVSRDKINNYR